MAISGSAKSLLENERSVVSIARENASSVAASTWLRRLVRATVGLLVVPVKVLPLLRLAPFDSSTEEGRSKERYRRVALTTVASVASRGIGLVTLLVSVPLTLTYLGAERYGMWMTISSLVAVLNFADLGMGNGLMN